MKNVRKFLDLSTGNLPEETVMKIADGTFPIPTLYENYYGFIFNVRELLSDYVADGVTCEYFLKIMAFAIDSGCDYVLFDADGTSPDWLPSFDW